MRNINLIKVANLVSIFLVLAIVLIPLLVPLVAEAQFRVPGTSKETGSADDPLKGGDTKISELIIRIIQILLAIAGLIAVIFLIVGGFRYITAGGNEESAESAKKTIQNSIIGIVIIILAFVIVRVIANALIGGAATGV